MNLVVWERQVLKLEFNNIPASICGGGTCCAVKYLPAIGSEQVTTSSLTLLEPVLPQRGFSAGVVCVVMSAFTWPILSSKFMFLYAPGRPVMVIELMYLEEECPRFSF